MVKVFIHFTFFSFKGVHLVVCKRLRRLKVKLEVWQKVYFISLEKYRAKTKNCIFSKN